MSGRRPRWEAVAPKPPGHFDFDTNAWTSDGPTLLGRSAGLRVPWTSPEPGHWIETAQRPPSFEERLWSRPWLLALYLAVLLAVGLSRFVLLLDAFSLCAFVMCCALPLLAIVTIYSIDSKTDWMTGAHKVLEDARDPDVCPVLLTIFRDGLITGEDSGVAWFEGPSLCASTETPALSLLAGATCAPRRNGSQLPGWDSWWIRTVLSS